MYMLFSPDHIRSGSVLLFDESEAQSFRANVKGVKILRCHPVPRKKIGYSCTMLSINPLAFSDSNEVLLDEETGSVVIL